MLWSGLTPLCLLCLVDLNLMVSSDKETTGYDMTIKAS